MTVPWIDEAKLKAGADKIVPMLESVAAFAPGSEITEPVLHGILALCDSDQYRPEFVALLNKATGAVKPA